MLRLPKFLLLSSVMVSLFISSRAFADESRLNGFYVGMAGGVIVMDSTVRFPATPTQPQRKYVDQGGDGLAIDLRGGWGTVAFPHTYLGVEAEVSFPINVTSRLMTPENEYRARLRTEFGAFARAGITPDNRTMFFVRAGAVVPRQSFQSVSGQQPQSADWSLVPAFGIGTEINMTRHLVVRLDATYTMGTGTNNIETYRFSGGIAWRF